MKTKCDRGCGAWTAECEADMHDGMCKPVPDEELPRPEAELRTSESMSLNGSNREVRAGINLKGGNK
jgi:hypothetical protein